MTNTNSVAATATGKLILVGLPLGNKDDISLRALASLSAAPYIAAEDTRQVIKLFQIHSICNRPQLISYREQNHARVSAQILQLLSSGHDVLLVSDRGMPTISDPGYKLVREAIDTGFEVTSIPGPTAVTTALAVSGLPTDRFAFLGFLPRKAKKQRDLLSAFKDLDTTLVMYESPFRVADTLENIVTALGPDAQVVVARELTKLHEELIRGSAADVHARLAKQSLKGEVVILVRV